MHLAWAGKKPLFRPGQCMSGFWGRSSLEQGHSEWFIPHRQVGCLLFLPCFSSCQSLSLETWQFSGEGGISWLSEVMAQNKWQPALLKQPQEASGPRGKLWAALSTGKYSSVVLSEGFSGCVSFQGRYNAFDSLECLIFITSFNLVAASE